MKKPANWKTLPAHELTKLIHELNVWNSNQSVSDKVHREHYEQEIAPLVELRDTLNAEWVAKHCPD